ncbi:hypothetical protein ACLIBG_14770 [Virgibacillus sp. W0181]|uniref:hypothetical protein n=1 Tax=Virgibacillus sp. W0181 TaxID=3391581 RepID=UPI003F463D74
MRNKRIFGWFGWSLVTVTVVVGIGAMLVFFNLFGLNIFEDQSQSTNNVEKGEVEQMSTEMNELVQQTRETVGEEYKDTVAFISDMHDFYNKTTGYGAINSLDWEEQKEQAEYVGGFIDETLPVIENKRLKTDLETIQKLAQSARNEKDAELIRDLHRMFHDLDIALNKYSNYDKIWDVTETLKMQN